MEIPADAKRRTIIWGKFANDGSSESSDEKQVHREKILAKDDGTPVLGSDDLLSKGSEVSNGSEVTES